MSAEQWNQWCADRLRAVTAVPGNLALVAYQPVGERRVDVEQLPGVTARRAAGQAGVTLAVSQGATLDGRPVGPGDVDVPRTGPATPNLVNIGRYWIDAFSLDGSDYELRIYDEDAPNLGAFDTIECYPYDPAWVLAGRFEAFATTDHVAWEFTRESDSGHTKQVPGVITVPIGGADRQLTGFLDGPNFVLVFGDATSGKESYAPGRFLRMDRPDGDGALTVDFNRAFIPPCGFSDFYSCPIPPAGNRLAVPVRAGEQRVRWKAEAASL